MHDLDKALALAVKHHEGQVDKAGVPYIDHVITVVASVKTIDEKIVAALHDLVEDTNVALADLSFYGFPQHIVDAVDAITKSPWENYLDEYIPRLMENRLAVEVKKQDLLHNMDVERLEKKLSKKDWKRHDKYARAYNMLMFRKSGMAIYMDGSVDDLGIYDQD